MDTKLEKFSVDMRSAPKRIGGGDFFDKCDDAGMDMRAALAIRFGKPSPVAAKELSMPGYNSIRFEQKEGITPFIPVTGEEDPELSVGIEDPWSFVSGFHGAVSDGELVAESEVFESKLFFGFEAGNNGL